jgi:hypothetical protein
MFSAKNKNIELLRMKSEIFITGVTILLSLTVFLNLVAEKMPSTSDAVPLIGRICCFPAGRQLDTWRGREVIKRLSNDNNRSIILPSTNYKRSWGSQSKVIMMTPQLSQENIIQWLLPTIQCNNSTRRCSATEKVSTLDTACKLHAVSQLCLTLPIVWRTSDTAFQDLTLLLCQVYYSVTAVNWRMILLAVFSRLVATVII